MAFTISALGHGFLTPEYRFSHDAPEAREFTSRAEAERVLSELQPEPGFPSHAGVLAAPGTTSDDAPLVRGAPTDQDHPDDIPTKELSMNHIISRTTGEVFSSMKNRKDTEAKFGRMPPEERADRVIVGSVADLAAFSIAGLTAVYNGVAEKTIKKLENKNAKTCARVLAALDAAAVAEGNPPVEGAPDVEKTGEKKTGKTGGKKTGKTDVEKTGGKKTDVEKTGGKKTGKKTGKTVKGDGPRAGTKFRALLDRLEKGSANPDQLCKASEFDEPNCRTAIGILRAGRSGGKTYAIVYDRDAKLYSL